MTESHAEKNLLSDISNHPWSKKFHLDIEQAVINFYGSRSLTIWTKKFFLKHQDGSFILFPRRLNAVKKNAGSFKEPARLFLCVSVKDHR